MNVNVQEVYRKTIDEEDILANNTVYSLSSRPEAMPVRRNRARCRDRPWPQCRRAAFNKFNTSIMYKYNHLNSPHSIPVP